MLDGIDGARTWCGWGVLAHNATKIAVLIEERNTSTAPPVPNGPGGPAPPDHPAARHHPPKHRVA